MNRALSHVVALLLLLVAGCNGPNQGSGVAHSSAVAAALSTSANLSHAQVSTFHAEVRSGWAVAYDPAVPAGCAPGGLGVAAGERPCRAYVLQRVKMTWKLRAVGVPGALSLPEGVPADLGAPDQLTYLGI